MEDVAYYEWSLWCGGYPFSAADNSPPRIVPQTRALRETPRFFIASFLASGDF